MEKQKDNEMSLIDHLQELRKRLVWVAIIFIITLVIGFITVQPVINYFMKLPVAQNIEMNAFALSDGIRVYLQFAFLIALTVTLPFALFQVWRFVAPGLTKKERRATAWFIPIAFLLFLIGISFSYFIIFPMIVVFLSNISGTLGIQETYGISQYFGFMFNMIIPFGLLFELPLIVVFLTRIGVLNPRTLKRFRKLAYLILVVVAASITPPELVSEILVSVPLILLYEFSVWLSKITSVKRKKNLEKFHEEENKDSGNEADNKEKKE